MCTVTIIYKGNNDFVLTSNRDESPNRIALPPDFYTINNTNMLFPKDEISNGTWIGVSEKNRVICILNGGFENHEKETGYRKSRGIVAKEFLAMQSINDAHKYDFSNIEPFTLISADWGNSLNFYEIVWDGKTPHFNQLKPKAHIRSSSTLYNKSMRNERLQWFKGFNSKYSLNAQYLLKFHKEAGTSNDDYGVIMNRGHVKTTSITQIEKTGDKIEMRYENLKEKTITNRIFNLSQIVND